MLEDQHLNNNKLKEIVKKFNLEEKDEERILVFLVVMNLVAQASVIKNIAEKIIDEYND